MPARMVPVAWAQSHSTVRVTAARPASLAGHSRCAHDDDDTKTFASTSAPAHGRGHTRCRRSRANARCAGRRGVRCAAEGGFAGFEDVKLPEKKAAPVKAPEPEAAAPTAPAESREKEFPGFPKLLWQTRSKLTGDPVRVIEVGTSSQCHLPAAHLACIRCTPGVSRSSPVRALHLLAPRYCMAAPRSSSTSSLLPLAA
jgi:hypothetical protein